MILVVIEKSVTRIREWTKKGTEELRSWSNVQHPETSNQKPVTIILILIMVVILTENPWPMQ